MEQSRRLSGEKICGPACNEEESCASVFYQLEQVCVPVKVTPFAISENAIARCCGNPVVTQDTTCPSGKKYCTFTITQPLCIEIPIAFGADVETGAATVQCGGISEEPCRCGDTDTLESTETKGNVEQRMVKGRSFMGRR